MRESLNFLGQRKQINNNKKNPTQQNTKSLLVYDLAFSKYSYLEEADLFKASPGTENMLVINCVSLA